MKYRSEIDGLRGISIIPVILYHAGFKTFSGGYIGVDIFFVISGYLITSIILNKIKDNNFSLKEFYLRRARRILPALFAVILFSLPFAFLWMDIINFKNYIKTIIYSLFFISNFFFIFNHQHYFADIAQNNPLLHTWSLSIEEQFYLIFPIFLIIIFRFLKYYVEVLILFIAISSFFIALYVGETYRGANFYFTFSRVWEIFLGVLSAFFLEKKFNFNKLTNEFFSFLGIIVILISIFFIKNNIKYPHLITLLPTLGTVLVILFSNKNTFIGKLLSFKWLVFIGLISYSLYLWHYPILIFWEFRWIENNNLLTKLILLVFTFIISFFSWQYIEKPFRDDKFFKKIKPYFLKSVSFFMTIFITYSLFFLMTDTQQNRKISNNLTIKELEQKMAPSIGFDEICIHGVIDNKCSNSSKPEVVIWGDSHAMHLVKSFIKSNKNVKLVQLTKNTCLPILNVAPKTYDSPQEKKWGNDCINFNQDVINYINKTKSIKYVVLSGAFEKYLLKSKFYSNKNGDIFLDYNSLREKLILTLSELEKNNIEPIIVSSIPSPINLNVHKCLKKRTIFNSNPNKCNFKKIDIEPRFLKGKEFILKLNNYKKVLMDEILCTKEVCKVYIDDKYIYRDNEHLSISGSEYIGSKFDFYKFVYEK